MRLLPASLSWRAALVPAAQVSALGRESTSRNGRAAQPGPLGTNQVQAGAPVAGAQVAVVLCSDVFDRPELPISLQHATSLLLARAPGTQVIAVRQLCARFSELPDAFSSLAVARVVVGCARGKEREQRICRVLRDRGAHPSGLQVVDLSSTPGAGPALAGEQLVARLWAALARTSSADLNAPVCERTSEPGAAAFSRRDLFSLSCSASHPVATWAAGSCTGHGAARPCVASCPHGALSCRGSRITVDPARCTGCGACVRTCSTGAMALNGGSVAELESGGCLLAHEARRLGLGVMLVCSRAAKAAPLGSAWLPLEVPSLEMVTAGWALQYVAAGVPVALMGCADAACADRATKVAGFASLLVGEVAPEHRGMVALQYDLAPPGAQASCRAAVAHVQPAAFRLHFREPEATVLAVQQLASEAAGACPADGREELPGHSRPEPPSELAPPKYWRLESTEAPLGEVDIAEALCSGCGCCLQACPSGALLMAAGRGRGLAFAFDPRACSACGACVRSCPEGAISLARAVSSSVLSRSQKVIPAVEAKDRCPLCGRATDASPVSKVVASRLAGSHPEVAARLRAQDCCDNCLATTLPKSGQASAGLAATGQWGSAQWPRPQAGHAAPSRPL
ncbi:MAG TPA: 4Fe-4S binding protein [Acidimicrobiales bacterium]|nr:4Fe-4S binding protein [Acidimicrobiales bacterium]